MRPVQCLGILLVSALFAGCAAPEEDAEPATDDKDAATARFELPRMGVTITDGEGNPTHRIMADGEQKFVFHPELMGGNLSHVDVFGMAFYDWEHGFHIIHHHLLEEGTLRTAEMVAGAIEDDRCTSPGQTEYSRRAGIGGEPPGSRTIYQRTVNGTHQSETVRPVARLAIDEAYPPCTFDFSAAPIPAIGRSCENGRVVIEGKEFYWLHLSSISLRDAADMQPWGAGPDAPNTWVRIVFDLEGDAELKLCEWHGQDEPLTHWDYPMEPRKDGKLEVRLPESELYGTFGRSIIVNVFNNLAEQEVTLSATVHYPSSDPTL